jgi:hypothetical protein
MRSSGGLKWPGVRSDSLRRGATEHRSLNGRTCGCDADRGRAVGRARGFETVRRGGSRSGQQVDDFLDRFVGTVVRDFEAALGRMLWIAAMVDAAVGEGARTDAYERTGRAMRPERPLR